MAKVKHVTRPDYNGIAFGVQFKDGVGEVTSEAMLEKARNNPEFSVAGDKNDKATAKGAEEARAAVDADAPPKDAAHPPMWPEAHTKVSVQPTGTLTETEPESDGDDDDPEPRKRGRQKKSAA